MIRAIVCSIAAAAMLCAADGKEKKAGPPAAPKSAEAKAGSKRLSGIPPGAVPTGAGTWRYTDPQGRKWIYRETPFGPFRKQERPEDAKPRPLPEGMVSFDSGDEVRFERPTPFGLRKWSKKKTELSETERRVWERDMGKAHEAK